MDIFINHHFSKCKLALSRTEAFRSADDIIRKRMKILMKEGRERLEKVLDVRRLIKTLHSHTQLSHLLLNEKERILFRYSRSQYMEGCGESLSDSDVKDDTISTVKTWQFETCGFKNKMVDKLADWRIEQPREKKLLYGAFYRNGYKLFDEITEKASKEKDKIHQSDARYKTFKKETPYDPEEFKKVLDRVAAGKSA